MTLMMLAVFCATMLLAIPVGYGLIIAAGAAKRGTVTGVVAS